MNSKPSYCQRLTLFDHISGKNKGSRSVTALCQKNNANANPIKRHTLKPAVLHTYQLIYFAAGGSYSVTMHGHEQSQSTQNDCFLCCQ